MPYEVVGMLFRCSEIHEAHSTLEDAVSCIGALTNCYDGNIPIHPVSQQYIYEIAAIDRTGNQRNFLRQERSKAEALQLDPKLLATEVPGLVTFSRMARLYGEALKLIPISMVNLQATLGGENGAWHFWSTDAGIGQALAYAQQAAFTLELSLKAYLEVLGKLASSDEYHSQKWKQHDLLHLFKLLTDEERRQLEEWWDHSDAKQVHFDGTLREFLSNSNKLYTKWRYITDLKTADLSIDIQMLMSVSEFLMAASDQQFRKLSPIQIKTTITNNPDSDENGGVVIPASVLARVEGRVRAVRIPEGFDPNGIVELVIDSDQHEHDIIAQFYRRYPTEYYGLEGERVRLVGESRDDEPHVLRRPHHAAESQRQSSYTSEFLTLRGSVHDMRIVHSAFGGINKINLVLVDGTFFRQVECFFVTDEERDKLEDVSLGETILIRGCVTLLNGQPVLLVGPDHIERVGRVAKACGG